MGILEIPLGRVKLTLMLWGYELIDFSCHHSVGLLVWSGGHELVFVSERTTLASASVFESDLSVQMGYVVRIWILRHWGVQKVHVKQISFVFSLLELNSARRLLGISSGVRLMIRVHLKLKLHSFGRCWCIGMIRGVSINTLAILMLTLPFLRIASVLAMLVVLIWKCVNLRMMSNQVIIERCVRVRRLCLLRLLWPVQFLLQLLLIGVIVLVKLSR